MMASCTNLTTSALVLKASREGLSPSPKSGPRFDPEILRIRTKSSAAAWRRFRAKLRSSFCTLKSYLSSGKSCAMAMSLFPMLFHLSTISSERERAELGGWFCVWDRLGRPVATAARTMTANSERVGQFISRFLLIDLLSNVPLRVRRSAAPEVEQVSHQKN